MHSIFMYTYNYYLFCIYYILAAVRKGGSFDNIKEIEDKIMKYLRANSQHLRNLRRIGANDVDQPNSSE